MFPDQFVRELPGSFLGVEEQLDAPLASAPAEPPKRVATINQLDAKAAGRVASWFHIHGGNAMTAGTRAP